MRADAVVMQFDRGELAYEGDTVRRITDPFTTEAIEMTVPPGLLVSTLENPVVSPGNPIYHVVGVGTTRVGRSSPRRTTSHDE